MLRASTVIAAGGWSGEPADSVVLDYDERHRRRVTMKGVRGLEFLLDLDEAVMLRGGDGLKLEDGRIVEVVAAPEPLAEIRAAEPAALIRVAWHLGNRHLPTELTRKALRIRRDPVIEEMARGLGAAVLGIEAPFNPEGGAYAKGGRTTHATTITATIITTITATIITTTITHDHGHDHHGHDHARRKHGRPLAPRRTAAAAVRLAVAGFSGRRLCLFARARMGGRGGRHPRRGEPRRLARRSRRPRRAAPRRRAVRRRLSRGAATRQRLRDVNELAVALAGSAERRLETTAQGAPSSPPRAPPGPARRCDAFGAEPVAYPVAVGAAAAGHGIALEDAAPAFALGVFGNLVSAAARLGAIGQTDGQKLIAALTPRLAAMAARALHDGSRDAGRLRLPLRHRRDETRNPIFEAVPLMSNKQPLRVGVGGPVGSGKTALMEQLCKRLRDDFEIAAITNDIYTKEDARILVEAGALAPERIIGVETGGCPHTAIREDASINLAAIDEMRKRFPALDLILIESGGDNLAATFSPELADLTIYVIDVSGGEKIPRKGGPGVTRSDLLVINKIDLAPYVGASLEVMARDAERMRKTRPFVMSNMKTGEGVDDGDRLHPREGRALSLSRPACWPSRGRSGGRRDRLCRPRNVFRRRRRT